MTDITIHKGLLINDETNDTVRTLIGNEEAVDGNQRAVLTIARENRQPLNAFDSRPPGQFWIASPSGDLYWYRGSRWAQVLEAGTLQFKTSVKCRSTQNIPLTSYIYNIDGVSISFGDRVLLANQTNSAENGIYEVTAADIMLQRTLDAATWDQLVASIVVVEQGNTYADTIWLCTADHGGTLGSTPLEWIQVGGNGGGSYSAANDPAITGIGTYATTVGSEFRFRAIKAGSSRTSVSIQNADILVDINENNIYLSNLGGVLPINKGGTGGTTATAARNNIGALGGQEYIIGNGTSDTFTIEHNLNLKRISVTVWEATGNERQVFPRIRIIDQNTIQIYFASGPPPTNSYRVVIVG